MTTFSEMNKEKSEPLTLKHFRWKFLKYSESYPTWKTTPDYKNTYTEMETYLGDVQLYEFTQIYAHLRSDDPRNAVKKLE